MINGHTDQLTFLPVYSTGLLLPAFLITQRTAISFVHISPLQLVCLADAGRVPAPQQRASRT